MNAYITAVAADVGISPAIIQMIIAFVMQLIAGCNPAPTPSEVKTGSMRWNIAVYRGMIVAGVRMYSPQGLAVMAAMQKHAALVTDADAAQFLSDCGVTPPA